MLLGRLFALIASMNGLQLRRLAKFALSARNAHRIEVCSNGLLVHQMELRHINVIADHKIFSYSAVRVI